MNKNQLIQAIQQKDLPKSIMLYGESHFLIDYFAKWLSQNYVEDKEDVFTLYYEEYNFETAKNQLSQFSLFSDTSLLLIKSDKKILKKDLDQLIEYTQKKDKTYLIYCYYGEDYKSSVYSSFARKKGVEYIRLFHPYSNEAIQFLKKKAKYLKLNISDYTLKHLYDIQNENLALAYNELDKIALLDQEEITPQDIEHITFGLGEIKLDQFIYTFLEKKPFLNDLKKLLTKGENEVRIISSIHNFIVQIFLFHTHIKLNGNSDSKQILGYKLPPAIERKQATLAMRFKLNQFEEFLKTLQLAELKLKEESMVDNRALLHSTLGHLSRIL